jgi:hypothetical protein
LYILIAQLICGPSHGCPILNIDYNEEALFFFSEPDMDCLNHQCDMLIQACTYEDHMALGPGQCPIVLIYNTDNNRESVEQFFSLVPVKEILLQMA